MTEYVGKVRLLDVSTYPKLEPAAGQVVACVIEVFDDGDKLYKVDAQVIKELGCDVGNNPSHYPFYEEEVEEII